MKKQNLLGLCLFIIGCLFIFGVVVYSEAGSEGAGYLTGKVLAQTALFSPLIWLVLLATPYQKKVATGAVVGFAWLASSTYTSLELYRNTAKSMELAKDTLQLIDDLSTNKTIGKDPNFSGSKITLNQLMQNYVADVQSNARAYAAELNEANLEDVLAPERLIDQERIRVSRKRLSLLQSNIPKYQAEALKVLLDLEKDLSLRKDKDSVQALRGFQESKKDGILLVKAFYKNQLDIVSAMKKVVDQADRLSSKLFIENGQLMFPNEVELEMYEESRKLLSRLSTEEQQIIDYQQEKIEVSAEKLREGL